MDDLDIGRLRKGLSADHFELDRQGEDLGHLDLVMGLLQSNSMHGRLHRRIRCLSALGRSISNQIAALHLRNDYCSDHLFAI